MKVKQIMEQAHGLLDDQTGQIYQESRILVYVRQAYITMFQAMQERNLPDIRINNREITVSADGTWTDATLTSEASEILRVQEKISENYWQDVDEVRELPNERVELELRHYSFVGGIMKFLGALQDVTVRVSYIKVPMTLEDEETDIPIDGILPYLSYEAASLAEYAMGKNIKMGSLWGIKATMALKTFLSDKVKSQQGLGVRRRYPARGLAS